MTKINNQTKLFIAIASVLGLDISAILYFFFIQSGPITKRQLLLVGFIAAFFAFFTFFCIKYWQKKVFNRLKRKNIRLLLGLSFLIGVIWSFSAILPPLNQFFIPKNQIQVDAVYENNSLSTGNEVAITWFETDFGTSTYSQFKDIVGWTRDNSVFFVSDYPASFYWIGKPGRSASFDFKTGPGSGQILIDWGDGQSEIIDLYNPTQSKLTISHQYAIPLLSSVSIQILHGLFISSLLFFLFSIWFTWSPKKQSGKPHWLWFVLPTLIVWGIALLTYWPGITTQDSMSHWDQIHTGIYNDWHSVFYSVCMWLLTRIVDFPAIVSGVQIITLSLAVAWGLGELQNWRVLSKYLWLIAFLQAFALQNMLTVIALWKDIPYSICLLIIFIQSMKVIRTNGKWLQQKNNLLGVILSLSGLLLFRKNGLFVFLGTLVLWLILYRNNWKRIATVTIITLILTQGFTILSTNLLNVTINSGKGTSILLHHIVAHVDNKTPMSEEQLEHLDKILPLELWEYDCGVVNTVIWHDDVDYPYYASSLDKTTEIFFDTLKKDPMVNIRHQICASELIWRLRPISYTFAHAFDHHGEKDQYFWVHHDQYGFTEASLLPDLNHKIMQYYFMTENEESLLYILTWRPAFYLYLSLLSIGLMAWKHRSWIYTLIAVPILLQSGTLLLINLAQDFRYQFGVVLIGIFCLGLWFIPQQAETVTPHPQE